MTSCRTSPRAARRTRRGSSSQNTSLRPRAGLRYSEPRLEIFNQGVLKTGIYPSRLAWFVEATDLALRQYIWVDAQTGAILMQFSQLTEALSRTVYNSNFTAALPGTLVRTEGGPATGDADSDNAYTLAGVTYNYYLAQHNRDSFDNAGGAIISTVHYCPTRPTVQITRMPSGTAPRWSTATLTRRPTTSSATS